jgi:hypothetical protein
LRKKEGQVTLTVTPAPAPSNYVPLPGAQARLRAPSKKSGRLSFLAKGVQNNKLASKTAAC